MDSIPPIGGYMAKEVNINKMRLCESIRKKHKEWNAYKKQCSLIQDALEMNKIYLKNACKDPDISLEVCKRYYNKVGDLKKQFNTANRLCKAAKENWKNIVSIRSILEKHGYLNEEAR